MSSNLILMMLSLVMLATAIGIFINPSYYQKLIQKMIDDDPLLFTNGYVVTFVGVWIVYYFNHWLNISLITLNIIGWMAIIKGILILAMPKFTKELYSKIIFKISILRVQSIFVLAVGIFLAYLAGQG